jgi:hypothetical protein
MPDLDSLSVDVPLDNPPKGVITVRPTQHLQAVQGFKNGDHPDDACVMLPRFGVGGAFQSEGTVVRGYRHPGVDGEKICESCGVRMHDHGFIDNPDVVNTTVCPGDWVMSPKPGYYFAFPQEHFKDNYEVIP